MPGYRRAVHRVTTTVKTHTHTHTYIYIYLYIYLFIYLLKVLVSRTVVRGYGRMP
jgi:hypothetical protein